MASWKTHFLFRVWQNNCYKDSLDKLLICDGCIVVNLKKKIKK